MGNILADMQAEDFWMPKPIDIDPDNYRRWYEEAIAFEEDPPPDLAHMRDMPEPVRLVMRDVYVTGCWMKQELRKLGCGEELAEKICFATGQRQMGAPDVWQPAVDAIANYKKGIWDQPGQELGEKLARETLPGLLLKPTRVKTTPDKMTLFRKITRRRP